MPGVKGSGGPPPKRSSQRRRRNKPAEGEPDQAAGAATVPVPDPDPEWHPAAVMVWESLQQSGQAAFYEPSDWAAAFVLCTSISRELKPQPLVVASGKEAGIEWVEMPPKGAALSAWQKAMTSLMMTEGDRRRLRLELQRPGQDEEAPDVSQLDEFRRRKGAG